MWISAHCTTCRISEGYDLIITIILIHQLVRKDEKKLVMAKTEKVRRNMKQKNEQSEKGWNKEKPKLGNVYRKKERLGKTYDTN